jgi:hypothetical protein
LLISLCDTFADRHFATSYSGGSPLRPVSAGGDQAGIHQSDRQRNQIWRLRACRALGIRPPGDSHHCRRWAGHSAGQAAIAFEPFRRLETSRNRDTGGVGLGLTIARDIVRSHGGEISLGDPPQGKGLEVAVTLQLPSAKPA